MACDFLVSVTSTFRVLYVIVVIEHRCFQEPVDSDQPLGSFFSMVEVDHPTKTLATLHSTIKTVCNAGTLHHG